MAESMNGLKRTNYCGTLLESDISKSVVVMGWAQKKRNLGSLIFVDLRDRTGIIQAVFDKTINEEYQSYNNKIKSLQEELNSLTEKLQSTENNLISIREEEKKYMDELHTVYGDFSLNDLYESIYI